MAAYGGVIDVGSSTTKIGYSGEDSPRFMINSDVGVQSENKICGLGDNQSWAPNCEIVNPYQDGIIENWDVYESLINNSYKSMRLNSKDYPILSTEVSWITRKEREKLAEIYFETLETPAFYLAKNAVLSSFAHGKATSLVLDSGAGVTSAVPVYEDIQRQALAGDFLSQYILDDFKNTIKYDPIPPYLIKEKKALEPNSQPEVVKLERPNTTESFHKRMQIKCIEEFKEAVCQVLEVNYDERIAHNRPNKPHEFPDGFNSFFGHNRYRYPELLFQPERILNTNQGLPTTFIGTTRLVTNSINSCDVDLRPHLFNSIIVTGGTTLLTGYNNRLYAELSQSRVKLLNTPLTWERRYSNWLGGSILASLGTFHQLWISKQEYGEFGSSIVEKKCP